eukprot:11174265-Lingulodinium_polyedra.AAC.1
MAHPPVQAARAIPHEPSSLAEWAQPGAREKPGHEFREPRGSRRMRAEPWGQQEGVREGGGAGAFWRPPPRRG